MDRNAWICQKCDPPRRVFVLPGDPSPPRCKEHGKMIRQINVPYKRPDTSKPVGRGRRVGKGKR